MDSIAGLIPLFPYVGIPLAVLGVLPTLYTCLKCLLTLRLVRSTLYRSGVTNATTRSSFLSGIIEIEIPRKRLTPLDRDDPRYFELCPHPTLLRGGTWTLFQWKQMTIGLKSYRVQFHDEVRMPQAEVEFEPLIAFLLDRGAVPNPAGFALLWHSGLWTPAGTKLLSSPRGAEAVLSVTASDDSDGILSLALDWEPEWQKHHATSLPPYWIRIEGPPARKKLSEAIDSQEGNSTKNDEKRPDSANKSTTILTNDFDPAIHLHLTASGLSDALYEIPFPTPIKPTYDSPTHSHPSITHLLPAPIHPTIPSSSSAAWFATATTALHTLSPHPSLWSFALPSPLTHLALRPTIPLGALDLLHLIPRSPTWRAPQPSAETALMLRQQAEQAALMQRIASMREEERILDRVERSRVVGERMVREGQEGAARWQRERLEERRREEEELVEAVRSVRCEVRMVARVGVRWLVGEGDVVVEGMGLEVGAKEGRAAEEGEEERDGKGEVLGKEVLVTVVERVLYLLVEDSDLAVGVVEILELWKEWGEVSGMTVQHLHMLRGTLRSFAYAALIMDIIKEAATTQASSVVSDLQECLGAWKKVRLG
ncbi:hypothetical protein EV356DRAFT_525059 [Viridothelium virens]|uniref:Uncharacterized protein n=1 Tax=Viridothelium virens TaxID=1048519 RepID=A0A6A6H3U4_VIRVR|nr:hypothetical protein EV356DRAFT_525059 [Viridothelium virens]